MSRSKKWAWICTAAVVSVVVAGLAAVRVRDAAMTRNTLHELYSREEEYVPLWMKPHTVAVYDEHRARTFLTGGKMTATDLAAHPEAAGLPFSAEYDLRVVPHIQAEYDLHGFLQNIYYLNLDFPGETRLDPTNWWPGEGVG